MATETIYYDQIANMYAYSVFPERDNNIKIIENATRIFEENGHTRVVDYVKMTGFENVYKDLFEDEENKLNKYFDHHFKEFEKFLTKVCETFSKLISYKKDKKALQDIRMALIGFREHEYSNYDGICVDILNDVQDVYVENKVLTEKRAKRIHENVYEQFCWLQEILVRYALKILKILKNHELPLLFRSYPYGLPNYGFK